MFQKEDHENTQYEKATGCQEPIAPVTGATDNHKEYMNLLEGVTNNSDSASPFKN